MLVWPLSLYAVQDRCAVQDSAHEFVLILLDIAIVWQVLLSFLGSDTLIEFVCRIVSRPSQCLHCITDTCSLLWPNHGTTPPANVVHITYDIPLHVPIHTSVSSLFALCVLPDEATLS